NRVRARELPGAHAAAGRPLHAALNDLQSIKTKAQSESIGPFVRALWCAYFLFWVLALALTGDLLDPFFGPYTQEDDRAFAELIHLEAEEDDDRREVEDKRRQDRARQADQPGEHHVVPHGKTGIAART